MLQVCDCRFWGRKCYIPSSSLSTLSSMVSTTGEKVKPSSSCTSTSNGPSSRVFVRSVSIVTLLQDPSQLMHRLVQSRPAFLQLHFFAQVLTHLHDTRRSSSGGAGACREVIGSRQFVARFQPQSSAFFSTPSHCCTW